MAQSYSFEDLSGTSSSRITTANPFEEIIEVCRNDPVQISARYDAHRTNRNIQQRTMMLSSFFTGVTIDDTLAKLVYPSIEPGFQDQRNCLVFWARPPEAIKGLIAQIQVKLHEFLPNLWLMPPDCLHMTALEIAHSLDEDQIESLVQQLGPTAESIANLTFRSRARLIKPVLNFDVRAFALSFVPACGEQGRSLQEDTYTYHHLRRDLFDMAESTGVQVASRYVVPSAHLTIGRFVETTDLEEMDGKLDRPKVDALVERIEEINQWLQEEYWPHEDAPDTPIRPGGEWIVGQEKGLEFRRGTLWYGGGERVYIGEGF